MDYCATGYDLCFHFLMAGDLTLQNYYINHAIIKQTYSHRQMSMSKPVSEYGDRRSPRPAGVQMQCQLAKVDHGSHGVPVSGALPAHLVPGGHDRRLWHRLGWWLAAV
jgi:hypothetical protein